MDVALNQVLARRKKSYKLWHGYRCTAIALALHVALILGVVVGPALFAERRKPVEYVSVQLVRASALPKPRPEPEPKRTTPPKPKPEEPKPKPPEPVLPPPEPTPRPEPKVEPEAVAPEPEELLSDAPEAAEDAEPALAVDGPAAVQGLDDPDFVYGYYLDRMLSLIRARWRRPPVSGDIEAVVHFRILRNGYVDQLEIVTSSGISAYDLAGLRAVETASPLPPLPQGYRKPSLGVTLIMR